MELQTSFSELGNYATKTYTNYNAIVSLANDILARAEKIRINLEEEKDKINKQLVRLDELRQDIDIKLKTIQEDLEEAREREYSSSCVVDAISSDDDYKYREYVRDRLRDARAIVIRLEEKEDQASRIQTNITDFQNHLGIILNATNKIIEESNDNICKIKNNLSSLCAESDYNMKALTGLIESVENYLRRKDFVSLVKCYASEHDFYSGTSFSPASLVKDNNKQNSKTIQVEVSAKHKVKKQDLQRIKPRPDQVLLFQRYHPYAMPVKQMLLDTMICMGGDFQLFMIDCLDSVVFVRSKNAFIYETDRGRGRTLYIIGLDITSGTFPVLVYMHVGHNLMQTMYANEKMRMEQLLTRELNSSIEKANTSLNKIYESLSFQNLNNRKTSSRLTNISFDLNSRFFGIGLKAFIEKDQNTLDTLKIAFPESYSFFNELIDRTIKWR